MTNPEPSSAAEPPRPLPDPGLACLMILAGFHGMAVDPRQIVHRFAIPGRENEAPDLVRALRELEFKARLSRIDERRLAGLHLPVILELKEGFAVLAKLGDGEALVQFPDEPRARTLSRAELGELWSGRVIQATRRLKRERDSRFGLSWFAAAVWKYRNLLAEMTAASFFVQLFALITPLIFQIVIDKVLNHRSLSTLDVLVFALAAVTIFEVLLSALRSHVLSHTSNRIDVELGVRLFRHLMALPLSYFQTRRVGDTVARVRELEQVRQFLTGSALTLVLDLFFTVIFLVVMFLFSPLLTGIVALTLPLFFIVTLVLTPLLRGELEDKFTLGAENQAFLVETLGGIETMKASAAEPHARRHWEERLAAYVSSAFSGGRLANATSQSITFITKGSVVVVLWFGARLVMEGELSVGQLIAFNMLAARVNAPVMRIAQIWQEFQQMRVSLKRLADILDAPTEPELPPSRAVPPRIEGAVKFEHLSFRYQSDGPEVLADINFEAKPGEVIGVVGASGSGKSTLARLLQRLYVPERGRVLIDGVDLALVDAAWLRNQIGVVAQDGVLFNRSVRDNIALADPAAAMERVMEAARLAGAHDFVLELPDGYDTIIGERGGRLSGGQRQRLAIARALLTDPRLLILDEATSALDYESERLIQRNMSRICAGRTVFVIAHRLSTVRGADRILALERGRLIEQGDHRTLLDAGGRYAELHAIQEGTHEAA